MKRIFMIILMISITQTPKAQSLTQLVEQLQLDYEKLTRLKQLLAGMYTGYKQVYADYEQVRAIARGNFNLHKTFLDALLTVSPIVRNYAKVRNIITKESTLVKEYQSARSYFANTGKLTVNELDAIDGLYGNLLNGSLRNLEELTDVLTDNTLRMSDAERLAAINRIDHDMTNRLSLLETFNNSNAIGAGQRGIEQNDIGTMQRFYKNN